MQSNSENYSVFTENGQNEIDKTMGGCLLLDENDYIYNFSSSDCFKGNIEIPEGVRGIQDWATSWGNAPDKTMINSIIFPNSLEYIGDGNFQNASNLTSVTFGNGLKEIGKYAFQNTKLSSVDLKNVETVGLLAFSDISTLNEVNFGDNLKEIKEFSFANTRLREVDITSVEKIGMQAFANIPNLNKVSIIGSENGAIIGYQAFLNSPSNLLSNVDFYFGENVIYIGVLAFQNSKIDTVKIIGSFDNTIHKASICRNFDWTNNVSSDCQDETRNGTRIGYNAFQQDDYRNQTAQGKVKLLKNVEIGSGVTHIGGTAFMNQVVENIKIDGSEKRGTVLESNIFQDTKKLKSVILGTGVTYVGYNAFLNSEVNNIVIEGSDNGCEIQYNAFQGTNKLRTVRFGKGVTNIGAGVFRDSSVYSIVVEGSDQGTIIGESAFAGTDLEYLELGEGITRIEKQAFSATHFSELLVLPKTVNYIGQLAFQGAFLTGIIIPGSEEGCTIEYMAFPTSTLESVIFGTGVTLVKSSAFQNMKTLTSVVFSGSNIPGGTVIESQAFNGVSNLKTIHLGYGVSYIGDRAFHDDDSWGSSTYECVDRDIIIEGSDEGTSIGNQAFNSHACSANVTLGTGIYSIGSMAFANLKMDSITIPDNVISIGDQAFLMTDLKIVNMGKGVQNIGKEAFGGTLISSISLPNTLNYIDERAFQNTMLTGIFIPGTEYGCIIGNGAFRNTQLENIVIGTGVTKIDDQAFENIKYAKSIIIEGSSRGTTIGDQAFHSQTNNVVNVQIGDGVTSIGNQAFASVQIDNIEIPRTITSIGNEAFLHSHLKNLELGEGLQSIGYSAFASVPNELQRVVFKNFDTSIGSNAFTYSPDEKITAIAATIPTESKRNQLAALGINLLEGKQVQFISDGIIVSSSVYAQGEIIKMPVISKKGYTLKWLFLPNDLIMGTERLNIIAQWLPIKYKVQFNTNGGTEIEDMEIDYGTYLQAPNNPTRDGYEFIGWDKEFPLLIEKEVVIKAQWKVKYSNSSIGGGGGGGSSNTNNKSNTKLETEHNSAELTGATQKVEDTTKFIEGENKAIPVETNEVEEKTEEVTITPNQSLTVDKEVLTAYEWAYKNNVTTMLTLEEANPEGVLIRGHLAKMVVNYATNVLGYTIPEKIPSECRWNDNKKDWESEEIKDYAVKSCALGLMGLDMSKFSPNMVVTRAQFGTIMSRLLWGKKYAGGIPYYKKHLNALKENNIMSQIENPEKRTELRKWVWLMLMRSAENK